MDNDQEVKQSSEEQSNVSDTFQRPTHGEHPLDASKKKSRFSLSKRTSILAGALVAVLALAGAVYVFGGSDSTVNENSEPQAAEEVSQKIYPQGAAVTDVLGTVEYNVGEGWLEVEPGTTIEETHQLRTGEDSRAVVTLDDGSAIRLNSDSLVTFSELTTASVVVDNESGQVYSRVSASDTRVFSVSVGEDSYQALGTAYRTVNEKDTKGVEVFHSKVKTEDSEKKEKEVGEGESFFTKHSDEEQVDKVAKLDLEDLKDDDFLKWNKEKDEDEKEYKDKLGFIKDIDEPKEKDEEPADTSKPTGISAWGAKADEGVKVTWSVNGVNTSNGFKVVYSKKDSTPTYGEDSSKYVGAGESSKVIGLTDGNKWYFRVCAYNGEGGCSNYSNAFSVTAPKVEKEPVTEGTMSVELDGDVLAWEFSGKAPHGYKVVWNTEGTPAYGEDSSKYTSSTELNLNDKISEPGDYYVRVCAYTAGTQSEGCVYYSDQVEWTKED